MTAVTLACPLCAGNIQIDTGLAGHQVACPLCQGTIMLPPAEVLAQFAAPQMPPMPSEPQYGYQPPVPDLVFSLACPACANTLQVTAAMSGQQVGCPFCAAPIVVPPLHGAYSQPPPATLDHYGTEQSMLEPGHNAEPEPQPADVDINSILPPGAEPIEPTAVAPSPRKPARPKPPEPDEAHLMPPTRGKVPPTNRSAALPAGPPKTDRFPPGHPSRQENPPAADRLPPRNERPQPAAEQPPPPKIDERLPPPRRPAAPPADDKIEQPAVPATPPAVEDLLPPGALPPEAPPPAPEPAAQPTPPIAPAAPADIDARLPPPPATSRVDHLLPPGAAEVNTAAVPLPAGSQQRPVSSVADALLPPGAAGPSAGTSPGTSTGAQVPLPVTQPGPLRPVLAPGQMKSGTGLDALQVASREKEEDPLTEIKKLSPEEKARRRFRRNAILWTVCVVILFAVFYYMAR